MTGCLTITLPNPTNLVCLQSASAGERELIGGDAQRGQRSDRSQPQVLVRVRQPADGVPLGEVRRRRSLVVPGALEGPALVVRLRTEVDLPLEAGQVEGGHVAGTDSLVHAGRDMRLRDADSHVGKEVEEVE